MREGRYNLDESRWYWTDEMFSGLAEGEKEEKYMKLSEVIAKLEQGTDSTFECKNELIKNVRLEASVSERLNPNEGKYFQFRVYDSEGNQLNMDFSGNASINNNWQEVKHEPVEVTFEQAYAAYEKGQEIYGIKSGCDRLYYKKGQCTVYLDGKFYCTYIHFPDIGRFKWFILD